MALSTTEKAFVAAYIGSANRDPKLAAALVGCSPRLWHRSQVQEAIARLSMEVTVIDGKVFDVHPRPPHLPLEPISAAEATRDLHQLTGAALGAGMTIDHSGDVVTVAPRKGRPRKGTDASQNTSAVRGKDVPSADASQTHDVALGATGTTLPRPAVAVDHGNALAGTVSDRLTGLRELAREAGAREAAMTPVLVGGQVLPAVPVEGIDDTNHSSDNGSDAEYHSSDFRVVAVENGVREINSADAAGNSRNAESLEKLIPGDGAGVSDNGSKLIPDVGEKEAQERARKIATAPTKKSLVERFGAMTAEVGPDGKPQIPVRMEVDGKPYTYDTTLMTPYDVKVFLSQVVRGEHSADPRVRLQAADLLGKSMGLFSEKFIEAERQALAAPPTRVEDIRARLEEKRAQLRLLKGEVETKAGQG